MRRRFTRRTGPRRKFQWLGSVGADPLAALTIPTIQSTSDFVAFWLRPPAGTVDSISGEIIEIDWTLMRQINTIGMSLVTDAGSPSNSVGAIFGAGVIAWDGISDTLPPPTETPLPIQSPQFDWLWWWTSSTSNISVTPGGTVYALNDSADGMMFTKSARKLSQGTGLLAVYEIFATISGMEGSWAWSHTARYGYKLP